MKQDICPDFLVKIDHLYLLAQRKPLKKEQIYKAFDSIGIETPTLVSKNGKLLINCIKEAFEEWKNNTDALRDKI